MIILPCLANSAFDVVMDGTEDIIVNGTVVVVIEDIMVDWEVVVVLMVQLSPTPKYPALHEQV